MEKIYSKHSVRAVFQKRAYDIKRVILLESQKDNLLEFEELSLQANIKPEYLPWPKFLKEANLSQDDKHQGVCIFAKSRKFYTEDDIEDLDDAKLVLLLDTISYPQNLGIILRSAAFFHVDAIFLMKDRSAKMTPNVLRVAVGGTEFLKIFNIVNLSRSMKLLKDNGFWIYGLDENGEKTMRDTNFDDKTALVVGAEGQGLRKKTIENCDHLVKIPGGRVGVECLNAAVAVSIALSEFGYR